jgi:hypothetical protein
LRLFNNNQSLRLKASPPTHSPKCLLAVPTVGTESPISIFSRDVLPHPFLPRRANLALEETLNSTSAKREGSPGHAKEALDMLTNFSLLREDEEGEEGWKCGREMSQIVN